MWAQQSLKLLRPACGKAAVAAHRPPAMPISTLLAAADTRPCPLLHYAAAARGEARLLDALYAAAERAPRCASVVRDPGVLPAAEVGCWHLPLSPAMLSLQGWRIGSLDKLHGRSAGRVAALAATSWQIPRPMVWARWYGPDASQVPSYRCHKTLAVRVCMAAGFSPAAQALLVWRGPVRRNAAAGSSHSCGARHGGAYDSAYSSHALGQSA